MLRKEEAKINFITPFSALLLDQVWGILMIVENDHEIFIGT